jgi:hypothetical protein
MEYRKASTFPEPVTLYPYTVCPHCGEVFYNDTHYQQINCPNDKWVLRNCNDEEEALAISETVKICNAVKHKKVFVREVGITDLCSVIPSIHKGAMQRETNA